MDVTLPLRALMHFGNAYAGLVRQLRQHLEAYSYDPQQPCLDCFVLENAHLFKIIGQKYTEAYAAVLGALQSLERDPAITLALEQLYLHARTESGMGFALQTDAWMDLMTRINAPFEFTHRWVSALERLKTCVLCPATVMIDEAIVMLGAISDFCSRQRDSIQHDFVVTFVESLPCDEVFIWVRFNCFDLHRSWE